MGMNFGNVKMRGKKYKILGCGCCVAEDHREEILWKEAANEIRFDPVRAKRDHDGELSLSDEVTDRDNIENGIDLITYAKYTWGRGLSEPRIEAILAQEHADFMARVADIHDAAMEGRNLSEVMNAA